ncbi:hypothetical protein PGTUg99_018595 [Puccinia graminis f. sp. tritici]|uniref:Uncharacterized protein n=1 Tax=Puccinia graminis f. sp. tritici TaxID=56615 RepID=A0A5B0QGR8_PUCGR|nr:hypothetical protein PGTUg99_018595 [Puccinia graminis f. sp. tritici]
MSHGHSSGHHLRCPELAGQRVEDFPSLLRASQISPHPSSDHTKRISNHHTNRSSHPYQLNTPTSASDQNHPDHRAQINPSGDAHHHQQPEKFLTNATLPSIVNMNNLSMSFQVPTLSVIISLNNLQLSLQTNPQKK